MVVAMAVDSGWEVVVAVEKETTHFHLYLEEV